MEDVAGKGRVDLGLRQIARHAMHGRIEPGGVLLFVAAGASLGTRVVSAQDVAPHLTRVRGVRLGAIRERAFGLPAAATRTRQAAKPDTDEQDDFSNEIHRAWPKKVPLSPRDPRSFFECLRAALGQEIAEQADLARYLSRRRVDDVQGGSLLPVLGQHAYQPTARHVRG